MKRILLCVGMLLIAGSAFAEAPLAEEKPPPDVLISTRFGQIKIRLLPQLAPRHVENFLTLASAGFYDGTLFHRIIPGFMIQGGDPNTRGADKASYGQGGPGYNIAAEFSDWPHLRGVVSMARAQDPDSAGSQFFIVTKTSRFLDRQYTIFGKVIRGMEVVDMIAGQGRDRQDLPLERIAMKLSLEAREPPAGQQ